MRPILAVLALPLLAISQDFERSGALASATFTIPLPAKQKHEFLFSLDGAPKGTVRVRLGNLAAKTLHAGDLDFFTVFAAPAEASLTVAIEAAGAEPGRSYQLSIRSLTGASAERVEAEPNNDWSQANPIRLGETILASADDAPYLPAPAQPAMARTLAAEANTDWYRFEYAGGGPKLVFFGLDLMERDNIPVDVSLWRVNKGQPLAVTVGEDPVTPPHEVQALPGNKFTTRLLTEPGTYYIRVQANHPEYKLWTRVHSAPPYANDPRQAVRTAVDYILSAGDSWHANTPRRGGVYDRVATPHQETSLCVACHATHFPLRATLYAARQGYAVENRNALRFLTERFYNNPRPFFGFEQEGAVWARVISAPANVLGRMSHLTSVYEKQFGQDRREEFHRGVREYLKLYYQGRTQLPPDETNGNTPLVSTYEVAWYAWECTKDPAIAALIEQDAHKNLNDLAYQTLALAAIGREKHGEHLRRNAARLLELQRESGQWSMKFEPNEPEVEFATGLALWALQAAGVPASDPQVKKGLDYLLARQQGFGGWFDPKQSFENFRTPFRETQMAVLALSAYFPEEGGRRASAGADWDLPAGSTLARQLELERLGQAAEPSSLLRLTGALGDRSKLVQRTAAWAVRQVYSRHPETAARPLLDALGARTERTRWGATRVFATHFAALARRDEFAPGLLSRLGDESLPVKLQAIKGAWQFWFWTASTPVKDKIEDALLARVGNEANGWIRRNVEEAIYNIADENIRYLYNNWVPLLARAEDQERVIRGRLAIEDRLSRKFTEILEGPSEARAKALLRGLAHYQLRRSDVYDLSADLAKPAPALVYNRIGNDIEQITFFGEANTRLSKALLKHVESHDAELRELALDATQMVKDARFAAVAKAAGSPGAERTRLIERANILRPPPAKPQVVAGRVGPAAAAGSGGQAPDEGYFNGYVRPILEAKGRDGYACVQCHASHTMFNGSFATALNVIDRNTPEQSLLLRKPTSSAETEGVAQSQVTAHGGGVRFDVGSPEYNTILNWIRGAKP